MSAALCNPRAIDSSLCIFSSNLQACQKTHKTKQLPIKSSVTRPAHCPAREEMEGLLSMRRSQQGHGRPTVPMVYVSPPTKPCSGVPPFNRARRPRTVQTPPHEMQCQSGGRPELGLPMRGTLNKSAASLCKCSDAQQRRSFARGPCSAAPALRVRGEQRAPSQAPPPPRRLTA